MGYPSPETANLSSERRCIASGRTAPRDELIRFVVGPEGAIVPDVDGRLPGRGIWLSPDRPSLRIAMKKNMFARSAHMRVDVPENLDDVVEGLLVSRCQSIIGLARRANSAVGGFTKVKTRLDGGARGVLLTARGAPASGRDKMDRKGVQSEIGLLDEAELGLAFGREGLVHAFIDRSALADRLVHTSRKLAGFRDSGATDAPERSDGQ